MQLSRQFIPHLCNATEELHGPVCSEHLETTGYRYVLQARTGCPTLGPDGVCYSWPPMPYNKLLHGLTSLLPWVQGTDEPGHGKADRGDKAVAGIALFLQAVVLTFGYITWGQFGWRTYSKLAADLRIKDDANQQRRSFVLVNCFATLVKLDIQVELAGDNSTKKSSSHQAVWTNCAAHCSCWVPVCSIELVCSRLHAWPEACAHFNIMFV